MLHKAVQAMFVGVTRTTSVEFQESVDAAIRVQRPREPLRNHLHSTVGSGATTLDSESLACVVDRRSKKEVLVDEEKSVRFCVYTQCADKPLTRLSTGGPDADLDSSGLQPKAFQSSKTPTGPKPNPFQGVQGFWRLSASYL